MSFDFPLAVLLLFGTLAALDGTWFVDWGWYNKNLESMYIIYFAILYVFFTLGEATKVMNGEIASGWEMLGWFAGLILVVTVSYYFAKERKKRK